VCSTDTRRSPVIITTVALPILSDDAIRRADTIRAVDPSRPEFFRLISSLAMRAGRSEHGRQSGDRHQLNVQIDSAGDGLDCLRLRVANVHPDANVIPGGN
jgi:hypothetical protein